MDEIIKIAESLEKSGLLIDGATEKTKHEIKKTRTLISWGCDVTYGCFIEGTYVFFIDKTVASSFINAITGKEQEAKFLSLLALPLMIKVLGKRIRRVERRYHNMDKTKWFCSIL